MLASLGNLINEKVKHMQIQLRARDERIAALETENAMLYLKLAQARGLIYESRVTTAHRNRVQGYNKISKQLQSDQVCAIKHQVVALKKAFNKMHHAVTQFPTSLDVHLCSEEERTGFHSAFRALTEEQNAINEQLHKNLCETEVALSQAKRRAEEERTRRRDLHNTLVELRGNIRVYCRVRPLLASLDSNNDPNILGVPGTQSEQIIEAIDDENVTFNYVNNPNGSGCKTRTFEFERVFGTKDEQGPVFTDVAPLLTSLLDGYNVCIMAYGQTGSGKTHTMLGNHALYSDVSHDSSTRDTAINGGVIPRSAREILRLIKERESATESYSLEVSVFEIYNNDIVDLLLPTEERGIKHAVFSDSDGSQEVPSLTTKAISTADELMQYVIYGLLHRHEDSTKIHAHSSRSHLIVQLNIYRTNCPKRISLTKESSDEKRATQTKPVLLASDGRKNSRSNIPLKRSKSPLPKSPRSKSPLPKSPRSKSPQSNSPKPGVRKTSRQGSTEQPSRSPSPPSKKSCSSSSSLTLKNLVVKTKLQLVDLAGSECVGMSGVTGSAFRETSNINKSLSALADVLQALAEHQAHIPYRNTKLTHVLQDTIGGDSKLLVMLCVSPVQKYSTESLQGLGFGTRARQVARGPVKKRRPAGLTIQIPTLSRNSVEVGAPRHVSPVPWSSSSKH